MADSAPANDPSLRPSNPVAEAENRDRILAGLIHELKTPLSAIVLWASFLDDHREELSPVVRQAVDSIKRSAREEQRLIEDLGGSVRIVTGRFVLEKQSIDLPALVREVVQSVRAEAADPALEIAERFDFPHARAAGDPAWIRPLVERLLTHAIRRSPPGGKITVSVTSAGTLTQLTVADSGRDLPADFLRGPEPKLALPLAIVRQIVELHGGALSASPAERGSGARFTASLPSAA